MTTLKLATYKASALWASRLVALLLIAGSIYLTALINGDLSLSLVIALIGVSASLLISLFIKSALQQLLSHERLDFDEGTLIVHSTNGDVSFLLNEPYQLQILKTEGDHKERGGSVLLSLQQAQNKTVLLGALGRGELPAVCEKLFSEAREASFAEIQRDGQKALWLYKDGDMARLLPLFVSR